MNQQIPIITKVEFFDTSYKPIKASVSARNFSSLTYRKSGRVLIASGRGEFVSEADTLTFVPAGCDYATEIFESGEMIILHYQTDGKSGDFFDVPTLIHPIGKERFLDIFTRALSHSVVGNECACMSDAYRLFSEIFHEAGMRELRPSKELASVKRYMDEIREDVSFFCKKFDYRYDAEPWKNSKDSVERAIKFLRADLHGTIEK